MGKNSNVNELERNKLARRLNKYSKFGFLTLMTDNTAYCKYCACYIKRIKKYNIELHQKSEKHRRNASLYKDCDDKEMVIEGIDTKVFPHEMGTQEKKQEVSRLIGEYLLKGYRMLSTNCEECNCILLRDLKKRNICVECDVMNSSTATTKLSTIVINELDHEMTRENEDIVSTENRNASVEEDEKVKQPSRTIFIQNGRAPIVVNDNRLGAINGVSVEDEVSTAVNALKNKLRWTAVQLDDCTEFQECQQAAATITQITNALLALKSV